MLNPMKTCPEHYPSKISFLLTQKSMLWWSRQVDLYTE